MTVPYLSDLEKQPALKFPKENEIGFYMDFAFWKGIPSDRAFYIKEYSESQDSYWLVAKGYGVKTDYGNGAICVKASNIGAGLRAAVGPSRSCGE